MTGRSRRFTAQDERNPAHDAPAVQSARTATATRATAAVATRSPAAAVCPKMRPSRRQTVVTRQMFATRAIHRNPTPRAV